MRSTLTTIYGLNSAVVAGIMTRGTADYFIDKMISDITTGAESRSDSEVEHGNGSQPPMQTKQVGAVVF